ncbi:sugar ABC transporter permease [Geobacillus sp. BMUD]|uniref:carbohydrate ABC transporter permease n=1 Tax=Geobacillus sp. BMUD TaxID=2508876 RepID=UPI0014924282|nr:sugar ABC transporter permease [Geobacillus sp. BMUD]NNU83918.1 sugar ABC transporter permease [Geobacillus sp. BMUD]
MKNNAKPHLAPHLPSDRASVNIKVERSKQRWKSKLTSSLFVLPYLVCFIAFLVYPLVHGIVMSFQDYELLSAERHFVGWRNYTDIFTEGNYLHTSFFQGLLGTIKFVIYSVPFLIVIGLALALLVNSLPSKIRGVYRTIFFMPYAISASVMAVIFIRVFDTNAGLLNIILSKLHLGSPIGWLTDLPWVWIALVGATLWWTIGFNMLIFINALNEVSEEMYEAAKIDGANAWQRFIYITLPSIKRIMVFVVITSTIASFNIYAQPFLMTRGGPGSETTVLLMNVFDVAFGQHRMGAASAMALLMALMIIGVSIIQFRLANKREG